MGFDGEPDRANKWIAGDCSNYNNNYCEISVYMRFSKLFAGQEIDALLDKVSKLDQPSDILAEISRQAKSRLAAEEQPLPSAEEVVPEEDSETDVQDVAETMRRSGHLWMRIVSKYAAEAVDSSPKRSVPTTGGSSSSPAESPAAKKLKTTTAVSGGGTAPDVASELEAQRQKLVEVKKNRTLNIKPR